MPRPQFILRALLVLMLIVALALHLGTPYWRRYAPRWGEPRLTDDGQRIEARYWARLRGAGLCESAGQPSCRQQENGKRNATPGILADAQGAVFPCACQTDVGFARRGATSGHQQHEATPPRSLSAASAKIKNLFAGFGIPAADDAFAFARGISATTDDSLAVGTIKQ